jgi:hypothetical protein
LQKIAQYAITIGVKAKHRKTLEAIFAKPTRGGIVFTDIEALVKALDGAVREGEGSRVAFELNSRREYLHRPHPGKDAKKYQVEAVRAWLESLGISP